MSVPLNILASTKHAGRECGGCTACCTALIIEELNKPLNTKCVHECERGCAIYETRPQSCRQFVCAWLTGQLADKFRPDRCGIIWGFLPAQGANPMTALAMLTRDDVPLERVEYMYNNLRARTRGVARLQIVPADVHLTLSQVGHAKEIKPGVFVATGATAN